MTAGARALNLAVIDGKELQPGRWKRSMAQIAFRGAGDMPRVFTTGGGPVMAAHTIPGEVKVIRGADGSREPIHGRMTGIARRTGLNMLRSFALRDNAIVTISTEGGYLIMIHRQNGSPEVGTAAVTGLAQIRGGHMAA